MSPRLERKSPTLEQSSKPPRKCWETCPSGWEGQMCEVNACDYNTWRECTSILLTHSTHKRHYLVHLYINNESFLVQVPDVHTWVAHTCINLYDTRRSSTRFPIILFVKLHSFTNSSSKLEFFIDKIFNLPFAKIRTILCEVFSLMLGFSSQNISHFWFNWLGQWIKIFFGNT